MFVALNVFGAALGRLVRRARIVINLSSFGMMCETKWSRITPLLMMHKFVLSEISGSSCPDDVWFQRAGGVALCTKDTFLSSVLYFLAHPEERRRVAEAGHEALKLRPVSGLVRGALASWRSGRGCSMRA